jgi:chemotaxis protein CheD
MTGQGSTGAERSEAVLQGSFRVSGDPNLVLSTVLGSCVAVCLHDPLARIGGMNHFLLPRDRAGLSGDLRYGTYAMELLINALLKQGALKRNLVAKAFGGARMMDGLSDIGGANVAFARDFLRREEIPVVAENLGGASARRVRFWPATGAAKLMIIPRSQALPELPPPPSVAGQVTLF